ncbi:MAG TPA: peptidoglycan-binding domain-containing protein, partial [Terriglobales bacterium]
NRGSNAGGNFNRGTAFHRDGGDHDRDGRGRFFGRRGGVNVFVGGGFYGWPYWGPYWGYPYYYAPYGYYYAPPPYYQGEPAGVYNGRVINNDGGKDVSMAIQVQKRLARAGYYHGPIDGIIGDGTRRAIRNYERANGLRADGEIDRQLLETMGLS